MRKAKTIFLLLCSCFFAQTSTARDTCTYLLTIPQQASFAAADQLSNVYLITAGNLIEKYDSTGKFVTRYSNNRLGMAASLDVTNPLKIIVWYKDFQTAVFLDRNLTELGKLNLADAGFPAVRSLASSADGNLWVYDELSSQLLKLASTGEKLLESQPLSLELPNQFTPTCIRDDSGQGVFLSDPAQGVAVFDAFAQMRKILPLKGLAQFEVENEVLSFLQPDGIHQTNTAQIFSLLSTASSGQAKRWLSKRKVFVQTERGVEVYGF